MRITPIRFVRDVEASRAFYAVLGLAERTEATSGTWADLGAAGGSLGLHVARHPGTHDDAGAVALQFTSDERLDAVLRDPDRVEGRRDAISQAGPRSRV